MGPNKRGAARPASPGTKSRHPLLPSMASDGDIRVLLVLDLLLSAAVASAVVWGMEFVGLAAFTLRNVALATLLLAALTYVVVLRQ